MAISTTFPHLRTVYGNVAPGDIDAGLMVVPPSPDRKYTVVDCWVRSTGTADTCTSIDVNDGVVTTTVAVFTVAGLATGVILRAGTTTTGVADGLLTEFAANTGIYIKTTGAAIGTATAIEYKIDYVVKEVSGT